MKVLLSEKQLKTLIKEDLGVSRASLSYSNLIYQELEPIVIQFLETKVPVNEKITIDLSEISRIYQSSMDDYIELPVESIEIKFECRKMKKQIPNLTFNSGGAFLFIGPQSPNSSYLSEPSLELPKYVLEEITQTVVAKFEIFLTVSSKFDISDKDKVLYDLRDTIVHECNHLYESFKRAESGVKQANISLSWVGGKNYNINREIFKVYQNFLDLIYYSEPYEINAKSQEAVSQTSIMTPEEFQKTKLWQIATAMKNFKADEYFDRLVNKIEEVNPNKTVSILNNLYKWFMTDYYKWMKIHGDQPSRQIEKTKHLYDLIKSFEKRINNAGDRLRKNYSRLFTLELEK